MGRDKFENRTLTNALTVVAIWSYLDENLEGGESLQVTLTIEPGRLDKTDYGERTKTEVKKIEVKSKEKISEITNFLLENLYVDKIHVAIE